MTTYRQRLILALIKEQRSATVADLAKRFKVSSETIRRDLLELERQQFIQRYHGGVCLRDSHDEAAFTLRLRRQAEQKQSIGERVAAQIPDGATVLLDNSSTSVFVARQLSSKQALTVITPSLEVAQTLGRAGSELRVLLPPGLLRHHDHTIIGASVLAYIQAMKADFLVFSVAALDRQQGPMDYDLFEAEFKRVAVQQATCRILAMDSSKQGLVADIALGLSASVDYLCTEQGWWSYDEALKKSSGHGQELGILAC